MKKPLSVAVILALVLLMGTSGAWAQQQGRHRNSQASCPRYMSTDGTNSRGTACPRMGQGAMNAQGAGCPRYADGCAMAAGTAAPDADKSKAPGSNQ